MFYTSQTLLTYTDWLVIANNARYCMVGGTLVYICSTALSASNYQQLPAGQP